MADLHTINVIMASSDKAESPPSTIQSEIKKPSQFYRRPSDVHKGTSMINGAVAETKAHRAVEVPHGAEREPIGAGLILSAGRQ